MPPIPGRSSYKYASPETWELIRTAYMRGESGPSLARRFNVGLWNLYKKAMDEGWSRRQCALREARGEAGLEGLSPYSAAADEAPPGERWTSLKDPVPPSLRRWPHNLPGMGPMRRPQWEPPAGYGPMPPELVPPVQRPPEPPEDEGDPPSPAEAADQAVAAAARALAAGRFSEAERLGRLAATLKKISAPAPGAAKPKRADGFFSVEDEEELPENERPLHCTADTCLVLKEREEAYAKVDWLFGERLKRHDVDDILAWTDMMQGIGAPIEDEDLRRLAADLKAKGPGQLHREIEAMTGRPPV
jgi:hypothetical protein